MRTTYVPKPIFTGEVSEQERLREIAHRILKYETDGFVPDILLQIYAIAYDALNDKRGFRVPEPEWRNEEATRTG